MEAFTLFELNEYIRRVIALNFEAPIWVQCEISQVKESRGNYYLELIQKDNETDAVIAQSSAAIWSKNYWFIKKKHGAIIEDLLVDGVDLKVKVSVTFHERYGMKLLIEDVDTSYTIGQVELNRRKIVERLEKEELLDKNGALPLPLVIQRIAIISSETAAGLQDFKNHLKDNDYNYHYFTELFPSAVQGANVTSGVTGQLSSISQRDDFDCVVIIRGGGSRLDLAAFDDYEIAVSVANSRIPVLVGIGHDVDQTVLDLVGHTSLKTPTAVADYLVQHNARFEGWLERMGSQIKYASRYRIERENAHLVKFKERLRYLPAQVLVRQKQLLDQIWQQLKYNSKTRLRSAKHEMEQMANTIELSDPKIILRKGFSITTQNGQIIQSSTGLKENDVLNTQFSFGSVESQVKKVTHGKEEKD